MTNTYDDKAMIQEKQLEETRCVRCVLERILRVMDEGLFVDYQMEKFGKKYKTRGRDNLNSNKTPKEFCKDKKELEE